jgi:PAS domain S-box-containing protein
MIMFPQKSPDTPAGWNDPTLFWEISKHIFDAIIVFKSNGTIVSVNPAAEFKCGFQAFEFQELSMWELIPKCNQYLESNHGFTPTVGHSQFIEIEDTEILRKGGTYFSAVLRLIKLFSPHNEFWVAVLRDISNYKTLQHELYQKTTKLETITYQMEQFLYNASHELRSPATTILGLVNLVKFETTDPTILDYTQKIKESAERLELITQDLVNFARTTYSFSAIKKIDITQLFSEIVESVKPAYPELKSRVNLKSKGDYPFYSNTERLKIILENLVKNVFQFADRNKPDLLVTFSVELEPDYTSITLTDNGIGIGKIHHSKIFRMFYRATERSKGAGLGLFIVKEALNELKGEITIDSEIGLGTTVRIRIPNGHKGRLKSRKMQLGQRPG